MENSLGHKIFLPLCLSLLVLYVLGWFGHLLQLPPGVSSDFVFGVVLSLLAVATMWFVSKMLIENGVGIISAWPVVGRESAPLIDNFKASANVLNNKILKQQRQNAELEEVVRKRAAELVLSVEKEEHATQLMQTFFDFAPLAICWVDEAGVIRYHNRLFSEFSGTELDDGLLLNDWICRVSPEWEQVKTVTDDFHTLIADPVHADPFEIWIHLREGKKCCYVYSALMPDGKCLLMLSDMTEQKRYEQKLDDYAHAKSVLLEEVNHRVKNNLAMLTSMLNLAKRQETHRDPEKFLYDFNGRVHALSAVHSLLSSSEWQPIKVSNLCARILSKNLPGVNCNIQPSEIRVGASQAHNLALVINEISTNSAKYSAESTPLTITLELTSTEDEILISYSDNGPGYPEEILSQKARKVGIGLQMVEGIVRRSLYGEVTFSNCAGAQTIVRIPRIVGKERLYAD